MRTALVLGGTGMLAGCAGQLVARGWRVVLPSRTQPLMADDGPGRAARASLSLGHRPTWVRADWAEPAKLASEVEYELDGHLVNLLVAWVHDSYRVSVLNAVRHLLAEGAPVVEVHTSAPVPDPVLPHPTQQVLLGHFAHDATLRTNRAVLQAVERGLEGRVPSLHHEDAR
ncbi:hypothetical protein SAMN04488074_1209 [Lentzea albidocapillata subsp. violacea]|uniref:Short chain dehydrogenase n=1 Tax=Lentzea albidocapillata subsp. violacea TaxID=128104 RepID=A0A1G9SCH3_9PSEU|nr:hypothetical protein [Lentzea albidocapillata]SDM33139.1 hypothetical protein SAMN04488074_1209 [Lentzea albidocapillata subsp. violacea]